ncbi:unnamed protein product [Blepharisma stoltei]|uniref:FYVE-type domain-containing protein n=1 Tax=Blepharisma stoltei TaxID=1481888 RepID=A0AAU9J033_9CILI|nr:unnamed protein product [Blepharisma stoltei]
MRKHAYTLVQTLPKMLDTSLEFNDDSNKPSKNEKCYICTKKPQNSRKTLKCRQCNQWFCKDHARKNADERFLICLNCFKANIHQELTHQATLQINDLKNCIQESNSRKNQLRKDINHKKTQIEKLEIQINNKNSINNLEITQRKIEQESLMTNALTKEIETLERVLESSKSSEKENKMRLESIEGEIEEVEKYTNFMREEKNKLLTRYDELNKDMRDTVPYGRLKQAVCPKCCVKIKRRFRDQLLYGLRTEGTDSMIESVLAAKASFKAMSETDKMSTSGDACHCIIF